MDGYPWLVARTAPGRVWHSVGSLTGERLPDGTWRHPWTSLCGRASGTTRAEYVGTDTLPDPAPVCSWCRSRLGYQLAHLTDSIERLDRLDQASREPRTTLRRDP